MSLRIGLLLGLCLAAAAFAQEPNPYQFDPSALAQARQRWRDGDAAVTPIIRQLIANADGAMSDGPYSVVNKKQLLPGIDVHDYVSVAPYYWPNPATADHLPYVARDGERNPDFADFDAKPLMELTDHANTLALAAYFTGEQRYADRAALLIRTWLLNPATQMNPNLDHCQVQRGINTGFHSGIIESRRFIDLIDDSKLLGNSWSAQDAAGMKVWIGDYLHWLLTSKSALAEAAAPNNHGNWYDAQVAVYALYTGDIVTARRVLEGMRKRIDVQITPDGRQPLELARTRGFWYCEFNLSVLAELADLARRPEIKVDLWNYQSPKGGSLRKAIDWLIPYATGARPWTYQQIDGLSAKELLVSFRRAEAAWGTNEYEPAISALIGQDVQTDDDREHPLRPRGLVALLFPPPR